MMFFLQENPYWGRDFCSVLILFMQRMCALLFGNLSLADLSSDEIQVSVLSLVAISSATVGTFLVLKKMTMLANSISHTILLGIVVAYLLLIPFVPAGEMSAHVISVETLLLASLVTGLITTLSVQALTSVFRLQEDASTGLVFTTLFALGVVLVTAFTRNAHIGTEAIMGNVDALHLHDLYLIFWITLIDVTVVTLLYKGWQVTAFDMGFANNIGFSSSAFSYLLMVLTSLTAIGSFRAVGVLLVLAFLIAPVLTARLFCHRLKPLIVCAASIGVSAAFFSVAMARHLLSAYQLPLSTAGLTVTVLGAIYLLAACVKWIFRNKKSSFSV